MSDNARRRAGPDESSSTEPFSLRAYLDRQHAEFARTGPTMAEILADLDRYRAGGVPREIIVATIREDREERSR